MTPVQALVRGMLAAGVGTVAMDALWFYRYKRGGGDSGPLEWEFSAGLDTWGNASAPGKLGKLLFEAVFRRELAPRWAPLTDNVMHWGYGVGWGGGPATSSCRWLVCTDRSGSTTSGRSGKTSAPTWCTAWLPRQASACSAGQPRGRPVPGDVAERGWAAGCRPTAPPPAATRHAASASPECRGDNEDHAQA